MPIEKHVQFAKFFSTLLDNQFEVAGFKFGIDPIIGLIPFIGDILPASVSVYIMWIAKKAGVPIEKIMLMGLYSIGDILLGLFPFIGDIFDFAFKSNLKCFQILEDHLQEDLKNGVIEGEIVEKM